MIARTPVLEQAFESKGALVGVTIGSCSAMPLLCVLGNVTWLLCASFFIYKMQVVLMSLDWMEVSVYDTC